MESVSVLVMVYVCPWVVCNVWVCMGDMER